MRIGIDARLNHYRTGGIPTYTQGLISALERCDSPHCFTVLTHRKANPEALPTHFQKASLWTPPHNRFERLALSIELARFRFDLLHSPDFIPPYRGARRHVITVHDLAFLLYPAFMTDDSKRYYNEQIAAAVAHADHILAVSEATRADLVRLLNVPPEKITVQVEGVDARFCPLSPDVLESARLRYGLPERFFLWVSTLEPRKNIPGLLEAYSKLHARLPNAPPLILVGKPGWLFDLDILKGYAGVRWIDGLPYDELPALYNLATALVMPSFYEGFGLPALEAMACGTVPIVSNLSSLPEVVGEVGLLVDPHDPSSISEAMERALMDEAWRAVQGRAAIERAKQFTWERAAHTALNVYEQVLAT